jgi:WD40 repeat protein
MRFEDAWRGGQAPRLEDFLGAAEGPERIALLRELLHLDLSYRCKRGEGPTAQEYAARFPADAVLIRAVFAESLPPAGPHANTAAGVATRRPVAVETMAEPDQTHGADSVTKAADPKGGSLAVPRIPGFEILGELGRGGMGVVYKARDALKRVVALKMVLSGDCVTPEELARFRAEAEAVARPKHPNIVTVYHVGEYDGRPFFSLEFVEGGTLAQLLRDGLPEPTRAAELLEVLARALDAVHRCNVVHRDLKPANVLLSADGTPKVTDFGLAKRLDEDTGRTHSGAIMGTPCYMAPEQASGGAARATPLADVYALGAILYECLTGRPPFKAATVHETLRQVVADEPVSPRRLNLSVPRDLETVCLKCLHKEAERRYASAADLAEDLGRFRRGEPVRARPVGAGERAVKWAKRRPALAGLLGVSALAALALVALGVGLWYNGELQTALGQAQEEREKADRLSTEAQEQKAEAVRLKRRAEDFELRVRYARDMNLAYQAWHDAQIKRVLELLDAWRPAHKGQEDLRGWEWHYLHGLCHKDSGTFRAHATGAELTCLAFSPDGQRLATSSYHGTVRLWDAATRQPIRPITGKPSCWIWSVAFSPNGKWLASSGQDGTVRLHDATSGRVLRKLRGHRDGVRSVAFSPDSRRLASAGWDQVVILWDPATGTPLQPFRGHTRPIHSVAFSPDGRRLASGSLDQTVRVWDAGSGQVLHILRGHTSQVGSVAFSPDGKWLASGSEDETVRLWNVTTGAERNKLVGHSGWTRQVAFSRDGRWLASASYDQTVKLWEVPSGREVLTFRGHTSAVSAVAFSPCGRWLASGDLDGTVKFWDQAGSPLGARILRAHNDPVTSVVFSPDGARLASASRDRTLRLWKGTGARGPRMNQGHEAWCVAYSPDGRRLASAGADGTVKLWDEARGLLLRSLRAHRALVRRVAFSPDGRRLASAGEGTVKLWDTATWQAVHTLPAKKVWGLAFSPDSRQLASASPDGTVKLWDVSDGRELRKFEVDTGASSVAFSPDGRQLASGARNGVIRLHDTTTWRQARTLQGHTGQVLGLAFSPDGRRLASAGWEDKTVKVWDTASGLETLTLKGHTSGVYSVAFSPDGWQLASGSADWTVRVWDAKPRTIQLQPDSAVTHFNRGLTLAAQKKLDEAVTAYKKAIELNPNFARAYYSLGNALRGLKKLDDAVIAYKKAIKLNANYAEAHCNLGHVLRQQGLFADALASFKRGHQLGIRHPGWRYPSSRWVDQCEKLFALERKLPAILAKKEQPQTAQERIELGMFCLIYKQHYAAAVGFFSGAFADPKLADELKAQHRYRAAAAALLAAAGKGEDVMGLDAVQRGTFRQRARDWLRADLDAYAKLAAHEALRQGLRQRLSFWLQDDNLATIRDAKELAALPEPERKAWQQLWADVAALLKKCQ